MFYFIFHFINIRDINIDVFFRSSKLSILFNVSSHISFHYYCATCIRPFGSSITFNFVSHLYINNIVYIHTMNINEIKYEI